MSAALIVPGHSVVRYPDGVFRPSPLIQEVVWQKDWRFTRTGVFNPSLSPNDPTAYLGGGDAVVRAAAAWVLAHEPEMPNLIITAGSAAYLDSAAAGMRMDNVLPNCEAVPMRDLFTQLRFGRQAVPVELFVLIRTTEEDIVAGLEATKRLGCDRAVFLLMEFRIARAKALLEYIVLRQRPDLVWVPYEFESADAWYIGQSADPTVTVRELEQVYRSAAGGATMFNELFGLKRILEGSHVWQGGGRT